MTKTIASATDTNKKYFLTIDEQTGHATACQCPDRQHRSWKTSCKHMEGYGTDVCSLSRGQKPCLFLTINQA
jgi:hypothetical protein